MLKKRGITNMHCYAFAPPMCCEPDLASTCSECITSVIFRDDIISRYGLGRLCCLKAPVMSVSGVKRPATVSQHVQACLVVILTVPGSEV